MQKDEKMIYLYVYLLASLGLVSSVDVSLDHRDAGFFLRFPPSSESRNPSLDSSTSEKFTLLYPSSSVTVRASYGPFSVKQTVLPALLTPSSSTFTTNITDDADQWEPSGVLTSGSQSPISTDLEISAHLVTHEIQRDRPVLRVLFHSNRVADPKPHQHVEDKGAYCVALYVHYRSEHLMSVCSLSASRDGVCLGEVVLPATWWPPLESSVWKASKQQKSIVRVEYALLQSPSLECSDTSLPVTAPPNVQSIYIANVSLSSVHGSYEEIKSDDVIRILVPQGPVYPRSKVYVPVYLMPNPAYPVGLYVFTIRARVKNGLRILGAQVAQPSKWRISLDFKSKETVATVTAFVKDVKDNKDFPLQSINFSQAQEVFSWLFEVDEDAGYHDSGRIVWQLRYALDSSMTEQHDFDDSNTKMTSRLDIQKDDVQAVLPIAKSTQLLNTAVLTGKQVSQPMKVFVVSQAGKVGDVTLQSSCHAADESILKVSPSCTSVYLDGSEIRGSQNASVLVKYGTYTGQAHFLVWMPELPLEIRLADNRLSQIKGWKTPRIQRRKYRASPSSSSNSVGTSDSGGTKNVVRWDDSDDLDVVCRLRYQQSEVFVFTRFFSVDHNSGREAYLLNRKVAVRVTELVSPLLRVADPRIASLKGNIVQGQDSGRTEVQVLSPITGRVIGAREVRVGSDKETVTHLEVTVVTGLHLAVFPDDSIPNAFTAQTAITRRLTSQYQEGLLDVRLHFSDGTATPLADISESDYHLSVDSFDTGIVAFAPVTNMHHPRVIAIGQGKGELLHISLELAERCQKRRSQPLAMAYAYIEVDYSTTARTNLQNDAHFKLMKAGLDPNGKFGGGRQKLLINQNVDSILYQDAVNSGNIRFHEPTVQARQNLAHRGNGNLTPLEIGMYSLLGVFCIAIFVFVITFTIFAMRYRYHVRRKQVPTVENGESVAHAHDWVWLGRATLERNSVNTRCSQTLMPMSDFNGNGPVPPALTSTLSGTNSKGSRATTLPEKKKAVSRMHRSSNISFPGSEISIRITTNPHQLSNDEDEGIYNREEKETSLIDGGAITSLTNHNAFNLPSESDMKKNCRSCGTGTISKTNKSVRIHPNPLNKELELKEQKRNQFSTFTKSASTQVTPPPVPPHRNSANYSQQFDLPPPVPPHAHQPSPSTSGGLQPISMENENAKQMREILRNVNLTDNPLLASGDMGWETVTKGMSYEQLMEYFVNLKESNA